MFDLERKVVGKDFRSVSKNLLSEEFAAVLLESVQNDGRSVAVRSKSGFVEDKVRATIGFTTSGTGDRAGRVQDIWKDGWFENLLQN